MARDGQAQSWACDKCHREDVTKNNFFRENKKASAIQKIFEIKKEDSKRDFMNEVS